MSTPLNEEDVDEYDENVSEDLNEDEEESEDNRILTTVGKIFISTLTS